MADWLVEEGIGEHRAILLDGGAIAAALVDWLEPLAPGAVRSAVLESKASGARRGTAQLNEGGQALIDGLPADVTEGAAIMVRITRQPLAEQGRYKLAKAQVVSPATVPTDAPPLAQGLRAQGHRVTLCRPADGRFDQAGWSELVEEAQSGRIAFAGGSLMISPTPAMTVIDVDGTLPLRQLALAAVQPLACAVRRLDLGGSVGIDFPSLAERKDRQAVDAALAAALTGWRGERTAMNGFGFVQLVSRLERPSLIARYQASPLRLAAITLARQAEAATGQGALLLQANPAIQAALPAGFADALERRTGRSLRWHWDVALAPTATAVQTISP